MGRVDPLADLVPQQLHGEAGLVPVHQGAVHQQAGGLVDGDQVLVAVDNRQHPLGFPR